MIVEPRQRRAILRLWQAGMSALDCGVEAGLEGDDHDVRQAVMGVVNGEARGRAAPTKGARVHADGPSSRQADEWIEITPEHDASIAEAQRCSLHELTDRRCRWPVGEPGSPAFFFCGGDVREPRAGEPRRPYCAYHCRVAYQPLPGRRAA